MERNTGKREEKNPIYGEIDLKEEYTPTGFLQDKTNKKNLLDLVYSVIIGVMGGIISSLIPFDSLIKVLYSPTGGTQLVSGHHVIWASIVYGLTLKKKNILLTMFSKGILEFLLGDQWGLIIIFVNLMEGAEGTTKLGWGIAGGFGNFFQAPFFWIINIERWSLHWILWVLAFIFAFISGVLITGLLGRTVKNGLIKAGVPTTF
jgi:hypothetical protein